MRRLLRRSRAGAAAVAALALFAAFARTSDAARKASWRDEDDCRELTFKGVSTERYDLGQQIVSGTLAHTGRDPVRNVKVCANAVCTVVDEGGEIRPGESSEFTLSLPNLNAVVLNVACSVLRAD